jgi:hypothetical protein
MSLKALAHKVLERDTLRDKGRDNLVPQGAAGKSLVGQQGGVSQAPKVVERDLNELIEWFLSTPAPSSPIAMSPTDTITDLLIYWRRLQQTVRAKRTPELNTELWRDLTRLREILGDGTA